MQITNKLMLPAAVVHAVSHDRYEAGDGDISCTSLIAPAQARVLGLEHKDEVVEDAGDRIWSMMGSAVHYIIENACINMKKEGVWHEDSIAERRFYAEIGGKKVSGQIDLYETDEHGMKELNDFKLTSVWAIKDALTKDGKPEWDAQLNIQRWLMHKNGIETEKLFIVAFARDWNKSGMMRDPRGYPPKACKVEIPLWSLERTERYIQSRLNAHFGKYTPECTPDETWEKPTAYALMKKGRQSALRVLETNDAIMTYAEGKDLVNMNEGVVPEDTRTLKTGHYIEVRVGARTRCEGYCDVAPWCPQYQDWKKKNVLEETPDEG